MARQKREIALPTLAPDPSRVCPPCGKCCRYVAVGIDPPTSVRRVSSMAWMLWHRGISVYESHEREWFLLVGTPCANLRPDGLCDVYDSRPLICREYDVVGCEGTSAEPAERVRFDDAPALFAWLKARRPALFARCARAGIVPEELREEMAG